MRKNIVVTGANRGIGRGIIEMLVKRGMNPHDYNFILGSRNLAKGEAVVRELQTKFPLAKHRLFTHSLDLESVKSQDKFLKWIRGEWEGIDVWVNNSGVMIKDPIARQDFSKTCKTVIDVNFLDTMEITKKVVDSYMRKNGKILFLGSSFAQMRFISDQNLNQKITNASCNVDLRDCCEEFMKIVRRKEQQDGTHFVLPKSTSAEFTKYWQFPEYMVSKLLLNRYAEVQASKDEVKELGLQVYSVCPGWVKTDMGGRSATDTVEHACQTLAHLIHDLPFEVNAEFQGKTINSGKVVSYD